jgi:hypothetical protein
MLQLMLAAAPRLPYDACIGRSALVGVAEPARQPQLTPPTSADWRRGGSGLEESGLSAGAMAQVHDQVDRHGDDHNPKQIGQ